MINIGMTNIITTIEADLTKAWGVVAADATAIEQAAWNAAKTVLTATTPAQLAVLKALITQIVAEAGAGALTIEDVETELLNYAESDVLPWVKNLGSAVLQAVIATVKATVAKL